MALDGLMLYAIKNELSKLLIGSRVEKIYQPTREELVIALRGQNGSVRLLLSAKSDCARVHLTSLSVENPKQPPMLCMLLRKTIGSARLTAIRQEGFERALYFDFDTTDEFGDPIVITLAAELMGRYSNLILIGNDRKIIDSVKRVGLDKSSVRQILPGLFYETPPPQVRTPITQGGAAVAKVIMDSPRDIELPKLIQETLEGTSPLLARELSHLALKGCEAIRSCLNSDDVLNLEATLEELRSAVCEGRVIPTMVLNSENQPKEFSFINITQYGDAMSVKQFDSLSLLLDAFYGRRDAADRMKQKMSDFSRVITSRIERISRKVAVQKQELLECRNRDELRIKGDLLSSSLHLLGKGMSSVSLQNYYDPQLADLEITLDPRLTPVQNAQRYYKDYRRADTAERMLNQLIAEAENELEYLDSVYDLMLRASGEAELTAIRAELSESGYLRTPAGSRGKKPASLPPKKYQSIDGFTILSGRNNLQNDKLTLKDSRRDDIWFHTQKIPGSHTIIITEGREVPNSTLTQAAIIAAVNSKARDSAKVAVDYTEIRNVKKQSGAKPGMVIYDSFQTAIVDPDEALVASLLVV